MGLGEETMEAPKAYANAVFIYGFGREIRHPTGNAGLWHLEQSAFAAVVAVERGVLEPSSKFRTKLSATLTPLGHRGSGGCAP